MIVLFRFGFLAAVAVLLGRLLLWLAFLCVLVHVGSGEWAEHDNDTSHVVTACAIPRCVWCQAVVKQLKCQHISISLCLIFDTVEKRVLTKL